MPDTQSRLVRIITESWGTDVKADADASTLKLIDDLKADSLDMVEMAMAIEDEFGVEIPDDEFEPFASDMGGDTGKTVADLVALVDSKLVPV